MTKEPCLQMLKSRAHVWNEYLLSNYLQKFGHMRKLIPTKQPLQNIYLDTELRALHLLSPLLFPTSLGGRDVVICIFQTSFLNSERLHNNLISPLLMNGQVRMLAHIF